MQMGWMSKTGVGVVAGLLGLAVAGCLASSSEVVSTTGGSVTLEQAVEEEPFYNPIIEQALIDSRLLSSRPLADFDAPTNDFDVVAGTVEGIGRLDELQVGRWEAEDDELGRLTCVGYAIGDVSEGSECAEDPPDENPRVFFQVVCRNDEEPFWRVFSVDERVDAIRLEVADDITVVGDDRDDTGLVAAEAIGTVTRATVQTTTGQVWLADVAVGCS